jgi:hypothetical protein
MPIFTPTLPLPTSMIVVTISLYLSQSFIGRQTRSWEEIIIVHHKEIGCEYIGWIQPATGKVQFRALVTMI